MGQHSWFPRQGDRFHEAWTNQIRRINQLEMAQKMGRDLTAADSARTDSLMGRELGGVGSLFDAMYMGTPLGLRYMYDRGNAPLDSLRRQMPDMYRPR